MPAATPEAVDVARIGRELDAARRGAVPAVSIWDALRWAGEVHGSRDAITIDDDDVTYRELVALTRRAMARLAAHGVDAGSHVALLGTNSLEWAVAFFATVALGARCVPLNTRMTPEEVKAALAAADATHLVLRRRYRSRDHAPLVAELRRSELFAPIRLLAIDGELDGIPRLLDDGPADWPATAKAAPDAAAVILFTSGSTASPKGCVLTHQGIVRNACLHGDRLAIDEHDGWFSPMPFFHAGGLVWGLTTIIVTGARLIAQEVFEAGGSMALVERWRPTYFHGIDTMFVRIMDHPEFRRERFASVAKATTIGPPELLRGIHDVVGIKGIESKWGLSEGYGVLTLCSPDDPLDRRLESVGRVFPGIEYRTDASGEILVRGCAMEGYYRDPAATAAIMDADGWIHTGDRGRLDGDYLYYEGRAKQMLKVGGENVSQLEVESRIMSFRGVQVAYVVGASHRRLGEAPVAFVVSDGSERLDVAALEAYCRTHLAGFKVPVAFVELRSDELPLTPNGKISKPALAELARTAVRTA